MIQWSVESGVRGVTNARAREIPDTARINRTNLMDPSPAL
jgi:hypothetical protein